MTYKGYTGVLEVDEEASELFGTVQGLRDVITFVGATVEEAHQSFRESVDFYLERCAATGKEPDRPFSGRLTVHVAPEIHAGLGRIADRLKVDLNEVVSDALAHFVMTDRPVVEVEPGEPAGPPKRRGKRA
jgi:predicted HicB family RNase H-like nuclease